jgi:general secretion pathway protein E
MDTLRDDGARKVLAGRTTVEEVLAATQEDMDADPVVQPVGPAVGVA